MRKYITLLSLITIFFVGIQQTQAQEKKTLDESQGKEKIKQYNELANKEKQQSPEHKAKVAHLEMIDARSAAKYQMSEIQEFVTDLSIDQQKDMHEVLANLNVNLMPIGDDKSKKASEAKTALNEEANLKIAKILNEEQMLLYNNYLNKSGR